MAAAARNRNKLGIASVVKPTWVCGGVGPDCLLCVKHAVQCLRLCSPDKQGEKTFGGNKLPLVAFFLIPETVSVLVVPRLDHRRSMPGWFVFKLVFPDVGAGDGVEYRNRNKHERTAEGQAYFLADLSTTRPLVTCQSEQSILWGCVKAASW